ncbi:ABC transporter permease [Tissierella sp. P1]|uniref:ABC transporter permease n=2 Tax=Tissierella TaxID=41273 RepID=UPI000BA1018F|nr:ABC transporter permease [Tissierella sp. P1]OZV11744.1 ABC transporter permease [Tissierella sp. P1]
MLKDSIKMSWSNIINNKMRSFLTILGIIIGVASIIALITIVQGATNEVTKQVSSLGADKITIQAMGTPLKQGLNERDLESLTKIENIKGLSPTITGKTSIAGNGITKTDITVEGKNEVHFKTNKKLVKNGRELNILDIENSSQVAIIGSDINKELFLGKEPIGESILINGLTFTIVGVLDTGSEFAFSSTNDAIIIPYTTAMKTLGNRNITNVDVYMADSNKSDIIMKDLKQVLNQSFNYKDNSYFIFNMEDIISTIGDITGMMSLLLAGIASISLVVGGIGIMNMMLVSVTERTSEIGLRKALGAEPNSIQLQFIIEAIFLSVFGGIIGLIVGMSIAYIASIYIGFSLTITMSTVILAVGFSAIVGIIFGFMPAKRASKLNPIDALRSL